MRNPVPAALLSFFLFWSLCGFAAPPTVSNFSPASAASGMTITITGTNFTGATAVSFGGTPAASFTVISASQITAVVGIGSSGQVQVTTAEGPASRAGFNYVPTSAVITDFGGYWNSNASLPNAVVPDSSHNLVAFTYNGITYSTGANNSLLTASNISFTPGVFRALPVAGVSGTNPGSSSTFLALARKVDGSASVGNTPAVASYTVKTALVDGINGLDLGTGVTNLPAAAVLTFQIYNIDPAKISDSEPDIILTQIAQPVTGNDVFSFIDGSGNVVGSSLTQDMTLLPRFGSYDLDLFNLSPNTAYNTARAYNISLANTNREVRVAALRLSDFNITAGNVAQVRALRITPSGNSDYAFIAYNANAINLPPNVSVNEAATNTTVCSGGTANFVVLAASSLGGALSYTWQESTNGGSSWSAVSNGGNYAGVTTSRLSVANATQGYQYRVVVQEAGNSSPVTSTVFTITVNAPPAPGAVSVSGGSTVCLHTPVQLSSAVTGGSNHYYQWQGNASGNYQDIAGANAANYFPPVNQTGTVSYRVQVSSGNGCGTTTAATPASVTVTGIAGITPAVRCGSGSLTLSASATSGTIDWFAADAGGTSLATNNSFTTPVLAASRTYYIASSGCASALRVPVTATVHPVTAGGSITGGGTVAAGNNSTTLSLNGATGNVIKWQASTDHFNSVVTDLAHTTSQLTVTNLTQTTQYRALVQSGSCASAFSTAATITVSGTLPIQNTSLRASRQPDGILVQWTAYDQQNTAHYIVERSTDGQSFTALKQVQPVGISEPSQAYQWLDVQPVRGDNYYRIREVLTTGGQAYSATMRLAFDKVNAGIALYPNPLQSQHVNLHLISLEPGRYALRLINGMGQEVERLIIQHAGGSRIQILTLPSKARGLYKVELSNDKGVKEVSSILVL
ncbi:MAG TPA: hypothetical protein VFR58_12865 [Flavisolibacter sp.]|nr:hypothetical protein [Flavisolibacter sp.]